MKRTFFTVAGVLAVAALLFMNAVTPAKAGVGYWIGDYVKDFSLPNTDGNNVSLADYEDAKGFIVIFTCNTCPYAKAYEKRIIDLDKKYANQGYPVIAINPNDIKKQPGDTMEEMILRAKEKGYTFPYLRDDSQEVAEAFGATKTPHVYLLNKESQGKFRVSFIGAIDDNADNAKKVEKKYLENAIEAIDNGKTPKVTTVDAIGCTIKWKS